jgi:hypothetical protein
MQRSVAACPYVSASFFFTVLPLLLLLLRLLRPLRNEIDALGLFALAGAKKKNTNASQARWRNMPGCSTTMTSRR